LGAVWRRANRAAQLQLSEWFPDSNDIAEAPDCKAASAVGSYDVTVSLSSGVFHLTNTRAAGTTFVGSYSNPSDSGEAIKFQAFIKSAFKCRSDRNGSVRH
jgi:hypothetical protein